MVLAYAKYPLWTAWRFFVSPLEALRNTNIIFQAFRRTLLIGGRAVRILESHYHVHCTERPGQPWSERTRGRYIWRVAQKFWASWILEKACFEIEVLGRERIDWSRSYIVVANHQSTLDPLILVALNPNGVVVCKKEVLSYPVIGHAVRLGGQIVIDRSDHDQAMSAIRRGVNGWKKSHKRFNLIFFAEGTRTRTGELGEFKRGAFSIARELGLPILPVAISGAYGALPKGSLLGLKKRSRICVSYGRIIETHGLSRNDVPRLASIARFIISEMLASSALL